MKECWLLNKTGEQAPPLHTKTKSLSEKEKVLDGLLALVLIER